MYKFTPIFESFDQLSIKLSVSYINVNQQSTQKKQQRLLWLTCVLQLHGSLRLAPTI